VNPATLLPFLLLAVPVGIFLLVNVLLARMRKARWREAAMLMNAEYGGEGLLRCGIIQGTRGGRPFKVEVRRIGGAGTGKYNCTWVTAPLDNKGPVIHLPRAFFEKGCDPAEAQKKVPYTEDVRVFTTSMQVERVKSEPLTPEEQARLADALKGWNPTLSAVGNPVRKESVTVQPEQVVFSEMKVTTDVRRMEALVDLVTELARRIESA